MSPARSRGGGWVVAQFVLIAAVFAAALAPPDWPAAARGPLTLAGCALALGGGALAVWSARSLGPALTPFPVPSAQGALVETGPYRLLRHPIYAGCLLFFLGWSLVAGAVALVLTAALGVLWALKARAEERHLRERFPAYDEYSLRVRRRLVPGVY